MGEGNEVAVGSGVEVAVGGGTSIGVSVRTESVGDAPEQPMNQTAASRRSGIRIMRFIIRENAPGPELA